MASERDIDVDRLARHIDAHWVGGSDCPRCGAPEWWVRGPGRLQLGGRRPSVPVVALSCQNCGHMEFIDLQAVEG